jgi:hypothetical protein
MTKSARIKKKTLRSKRQVILFKGIIKSAKTEKIYLMIVGCNQKKNFDEFKLFILKFKMI